MNPYLTLGIPMGADEDAVRVAYRRLVKLCHPDAVEGEEQKQQAQEKLIALNLAYEQALKMACRPQVHIVPVSLDESVRLANRLLDRRMAASAQRALERCPERSATWFFLHGQSLFDQGKYTEAHQSFRQAVRYQPDNNAFRNAALQAFVAARNSNRLSYRVVDWVRNIRRTRG